MLSSLAGYSNTCTQSYVVVAGDTLQGIAQQVYGDANLWYMLAGDQTLDDAQPR